MKEGIKEYNHCRLCKSKAIETVINLGETALANSYLKKEDVGKEEFKAPLEVFMCHNCGSFQLKHTVNPKLLFDNYLYASSTSKSFRDHFKLYASHVSEKIGLKEGDLAIDIGSNDSILLKPLSKITSNCIGVEPAKNLSDQANKEGFKTINKYFDIETASRIVSEYGKAKLITANNVFAHIDDIDSVVEGVKILLDKDGVFVFENAYWLSAVQNLYFDNFYSEHINYFSIKPLRLFFRKHGMEIFDVEENIIQGGTIRVYVKNGGSTFNKVSIVVEKRIQEEEEFGLYNLNTYVEFNGKLNILKQNLHSFLAKIKSDDKKIWGYGAPAKATTFLKFMDLNKDVIEKIVDDSKLKQNLFMPDCHIPIVDRNSFLKQQPDYCLVLAWNFYDSIVKNVSSYSGEWIHPFKCLY